MDVDPLLFSFGAVAVVLVAVIRFFYLASQCGQLNVKGKRTKPCKTLIVVGAGGHSMEMMCLLSGLSKSHYTPREYVVAENDIISCKKIEKCESSTKPVIRKIMRAREVGQSYQSSVITTLKAVFSSIPVMLFSRPDIVLCNGPGTCIPICFIAYLMKYFGLKSTKIVYVESICRVEHLSLSALLLYYLCMADHILVQWPQLANKYTRTRYIGRLI